MTIEADITGANTTGFNYAYGTVINVKLKAINNIANVCNAFRLGSYSSYIANTTLTAQQYGYQLGSSYTAFELSALGDVDQDWAIANSDRDFVLQYCNHTRTLDPASLNRADATLNSLVEITDAVAIINYASGSISEFYS